MGTHSTQHNAPNGADRIETMSRIDHMADIAAQIKAAIAALPKDKATWRQTWKTGHDGGAKRSNGEAFTGGNNPWLGLVGATRGYGSSYWFTSKQATEAGARLNWDAAQGQHATVLRPRIMKDEKNVGEMKVIGFTGYRVYNGDLCEGWTDPVVEARSIPEPGPAAAAIIGVWGGVTESGGRAFYRPSSDTVTVPPRDAFETLADYVGTAAHEKAHQSGHRTRLNRDGIVNPAIFGDHTYAAEELVAESAACFLLGRLGLQTDSHLNNSAAYLKSWNRKLESDPQLLIKSMGQGMRAAEYILRAAGLPQ